jgi:hypothetical protein
MTMNLPTNLPLTKAPRPSARTFLGWPSVTDLETLSADVAFLGIPYNAPYSMEEVANNQAQAPDAVRARSDQIQWGDGNYDCGDRAGARCRRPDLHHRRAVDHEHARLRGQGGLFRMSHARAS